eukprot:6418595-Amphidinium_carterae.2
MGVSDGKLSCLAECKGRLPHNAMLETRCSPRRYSITAFRSRSFLHEAHLIKVPPNKPRTTNMHNIIPQISLAYQTKPD